MHKTHASLSSNTQVWLSVTVFKCAASTVSVDYILIIEPSCHVLLTPTVRCALISLHLLNSDIFCQYLRSIVRQDLDLLARFQSHKSDNAYYQHRCRNTIQSLCFWEHSHLVLSLRILFMLRFGFFDMYNTGIWNDLQQDSQYHAFITHMAFADTGVLITLPS